MLMKVAILYRSNSEHARKMEDYANQFGRAYVNYKVDLVDVNTREGASMATLYDVMSYPAVLVTTESGQLMNEWEGDQIPVMGDINYYAHA